MSTQADWASDMTEEEELAELRIELARAQGSLDGLKRGMITGFLLGASIAAFLAALWEKIHG